jgi:DHA2 family multidrug resistance protein-like MFS transporter
MTTTKLEKPDGLSGASHFWAAVTLALGLMMSSLDGSIANLALPTLAHEFRVSAAASIWVVNSYQLAVTISLLPLAALGEIFGYRRIFCGGVLVFTIASLFCTMAHSLPELAVARGLQGFGAAGMMSVNSALVRFVYPSRMLGRGFGMNVMVGSASSALGPSIAAFILSVASWPWLFAINIPLGLLALALGFGMLPDTMRGSHRFDLGSAVLNAITFGLLITGIEAIGHRNSWPMAGAEMAGAGLAGWLLVRRQKTRTNPLLPVDLLRLPVFALSIVASTFSFAAQAIALVTLPFYMMQTLYLGRTVTGLLMTPWPLTVLIVAPFAGRLSDRFSPATMGGIGQAMMVCGLVSLAALPDAPGFSDIAWRMSLCGMGFSLFNAPNNRALFAAAPPERSGGASGLQATSRLLGQTGGTALVALLFGLIVTGATEVCLWIAASFSLLAGLASISRSAAWEI